MLQGVITGGTASGHASIITNDAGEYIATAGKTGTTDDNLDKWFCGYTPYYCASVWYGYDNRLRQTTIASGDRSNAIRIWYYVMSRIHGSCETASFVRPESVIQMPVCSSGYYATEYCQAAGTVTTDYFVSGSYLAPSITNQCPIHTAPPEEEPGPDAPPPPA